MKSNYMQQNLSSYVSPHTSLTGVALADRFSEKKYIEVEYKSTQTTRMAISWQQVEKVPYFYNWDAVATALENAKKNGMEPIWDLCYLGFPDDVTPLQPNFVRRFAAFCRAFVRYYKYKEHDAILTVAPIDETAFVSNNTFLSINQQAMVILTQACAEALSAMKEEDPNVCVLTNQSIANIISLMSEPRTTEVELAIAS